MIAKLTHSSLGYITLGFMEDITIVNGAYQPTFNWGATLYGKSPCLKGKSSISMAT